MVLDFNSRSMTGERFAALIDDAMRNRKETRRDYLGASAIGEPCLRRLQYEYRGAPKDEGSDFAPKTLRVFHRGHQAEEWMIQWIRDAGFDLRTEKCGQQFGFDDCDERFKGHIDGIITGGPDGFKYPALWENKCVNSKGFAQVQKHGVAKAYPKYAAQIAVYQAYMQLAENPAIFTVLNADSMEIYVETVAFDQQLAQEQIDKAARVLSACDANEWLPRASDTVEGFACRFCPYTGECWK